MSSREGLSGAGVCAQGPLEFLVTLISVGLLEGALEASMLAPFAQERRRRVLWPDALGFACTACCTGSRRIQLTATAAGGRARRAHWRRHGGDRRHVTGCICGTRLCRGLMVGSCKSQKAVELRPGSVGAALGRDCESAMREDLVERSHLMRDAWSLRPKA